MARTKLNPAQSTGFSVQHQAITTNTTQTIKMQTGWGFLLTPGGTGILSGTVTFPTAFTTLLGVVVTNIGYKVSSDPATILDFQTGGGSEVTTARALALSGFTVATNTSGGGNFGSGERHGYSWIAWGIY